MLVISRNPLDVMPSFALLMHTNSYSLQIEEEYHTDFPEFWQEYVSTMTQNVKKIHELLHDEIAE